jgi:CubicO group peptidase (beta-lactamase class C family)
MERHGMATFPHETPILAASADVDVTRLEKIVAQFNRQQRTGAFPGGQLAVRRRGKLVLNHAVGIARGFRPKEAITPVQAHPQTPFPVLSAGKPLAAVAIALLEDRGRLDLSAPIVEIFPEFSRHNKESITTLDVLTHRSGILMPEFIKKPDLWGNRGAVQQALIETIPTYPRGTLAYHPYEYGWILDEIVHRVDGRSLPDLFAEEIAAPLQLPSLQFGLASHDPNSTGFTYWLGKDKVIVAGVNVADDFESQNSEQHLNARNPATSLICDAASLAAFYEFILRGGTTPSGQRLISDGTLRRYTSRHVVAWDRSLRTVMAIGRGFVLGMPFFSSYGWGNTAMCFGHAGGFCTLAFGDYNTESSVAMITNGNRSMMDFARRSIPLATGLRKACT